VNSTPRIPDITHLKELGSLGSEPFPIISFDTSFVVKALIEGLDYHEQCANFIKALRSLKPQPIIIYSELLRSELWCANLRIVISDIYKVPARQATEVIKRFPTLPRNLSERTKDINQKFDELLTVISFLIGIQVAFLLAGNGLIWRF
jgi:hypothetical protein